MQFHNIRRSLVTYWRCDALGGVTREERATRRLESHAENAGEMSALRGFNYNYMGAGAV